MVHEVNPVHLGDGEVAALFATTDWSQSPLGAPDTWPQALRTVVSLMLNSKFPMFLAWGPELGFIYNDGYRDILGRKHPWALGRRFQDIWPEIWSDIRPIVEKAMAGEPSYFENLPFTMHRKGYEEQTWFTFSYSPVRDDSGKVAGMYCACTETTRQVLADRHRMNEIDRLRDLFQQAPGIIAVLRGPQHLFEIANDAYLELVGGREIVGREAREALPEVEGQGLFELLDQVYTSGQPYIGKSVAVRLKRRNSDELEERYVDFIYQPIRDSAGHVTGIFVEGSDVTDAVKVTDALRESETRLLKLANTIPQLAWVAQPDGSVEWFNDRFYEYTGTTHEQVKGWGWTSLFPEGELSALLPRIEAATAAGEAYELTVQLPAATGEMRTFFILTAPLHDAAGKIVQWFGTATDIHEIEQAQAELRAASRRKDEFLAMLAHELRNPLAPISTAAELLKLSNLDPERIRSTSKIIARQVAHMTDIVDDLLDVSRVTSGLVNLQKVPVDVNDVVQDALEQVSHIAKSKHQVLTCDISSEAALVKGDRTRLTQVFSNLLNNATRYTPEGGVIKLKVTSHKDAVEISVQDNGMGIDKNLIPHIFDLFIQAERSPDRAQGGLGLGLALVKSLVELQGGKVSAKSEGVNKGSEFIVQLPRLLTGKSSATADTTPHETQVAAEDLRVMVVDDNIDAAETLVMLLESYGFHPVAEYTATDALKRVGEINPHVLILDIGLPDMDGFELARRLKKIPGIADSLFIALTGYGQSSDRQQTKAAGFSHHLVKPVNIQQLLGLISKVQ